MEEGELEEGEAFSERVDAVDPDLALSYIDEKIKDVLGHFQKDFEGDVCIKKLGAKFGTYGSFLPAYPRSPMIAALPKSPHKLPNNNFIRSPSQSELLLKEGNNDAKVRRNAEIHITRSLDRYSSPLEGSPYGGFSPDDTSYGSPFSLFEFYWYLDASKFVPCLLSPVPKILSRLVDKKTARIEDFSVNEITDVKISRGHLTDGGKYAGMKFLDGKEEKDDVSIFCQKKKGIEDLRRKESVSNAQIATVLSKDVIEKRGGLLTRKPMNDSDICKESGRIIENEASPESAKKEPLETNFCKVRRKSIGASSKEKTTTNPSLEDKAMHHVKVNLSHEVSADSKKHHRSNDDNCSDSSLVDSDGLRGLKPHLISPAELDKPKVLQQSTLPGVEGEKTAHRKGRSSGRKSKSREHVSDPPSVESWKDDACVAFRALPTENKRSPLSKDGLSEGKMNTLKIVKDRNSSGDRVIYNASPLASQQGEDDHDAPGNLYKKVPDDCKPNHRKHGFMERPKDKNGGKTSNDFTSAEESNKQVQDASLTNNFSTSNLEPKDNWVCCDKCHKWRLLPYDRNPDDLPKKWLCSMQSWLPEMNNCSFTEEETKAAFNSLYHLPPLGTQIASTGHRDPITSGVKVVGPQQPAPGDFFGQKNKKSKLKNKRDFTEDDSIPSKKIRSRDRSKYELDHAGSSTKVRAKNLSLQTYCPSTKDSKIEVDELENYPEASHDVAANAGTHDLYFHSEDRSRDSIKKQGVMDMEKTPMGEKDVRLEVQEDTNGIFPRKAKKLKSSRPDDKGENIHNFEPSVGKSSLVTRILIPSSRDQAFVGAGDYQGDVGNTQLVQRKDDGIGSLKKELGYSLNSNAATSSSSKISGSHKSKTNVERRCSPMDSVSSAPLRKSTVKLATKVPNVKNDTRNGGYSDVDVIHGQTMPNEQKTVGTVQIGSLGSDRVHEPRDQMEADNYQESNAKDLLFADIFGSTDDEASPSHDYLQTKPERDLSPEWTSRHPRKSQGKDHRHHREKHLDKDNRQNLKDSTTRSKEMQKKNKHGISSSKIKVLNSVCDPGDPCPVSDAGDTDLCGHTELCEDLRNESSRPLKDQTKDLVNNGEAHLLEGKANDHANSRILKNTDASNSHRNKLEAFNPNIGQSVVSADGRNPSNEENIQASLTMENDKSSCKLLLSKVDKSKTKVDKSKTKSERLTPGPFASNNKEALQPHSEMSAEAQNCDASKVIKESGNLANENGYNSSSRHKMPNGIDLPATSRRSGNQHAATIIKEATDLKHTANRLQKEGLGFESTGLYFQAALKFLHGASLLEPLNLEGKHGNLESSMQLYSQTAKLCEFCAHEYEKLKVMTAAALAYKCMEVAYMKVVYSKHSGSMKDCCELKTSLPIGESPSSSASDVDNTNNQAKLIKAAMVKAVNSPQPGNHIIAARNRPKFEQILAFADCVNSAMEASRRSLNSFASANAAPVNGQNAEGMLAVRRALDFNFHDIEGLLRLIRLSMEFIAR